MHEDRDKVSRKRQRDDKNADRVISRGVLHAAVVRRALVIFIHEDRRLIGGEEGGRSIQVLVKVVLPLTGCLVTKQIQVVT